MVSVVFVDPSGNGSTVFCFVTMGALEPGAPGRPSAGPEAMTGAQRQAKLRKERKAAGVCPCCGK